MTRRYAGPGLVPLLMVWLCVACTTAPSEEGGYATPKLPPGEAGRVLQRGLEAAGGWSRWIAMRDVSFIGTLTIMDPGRQLSTESIGWYMAPLHAGARMRMDSVGLPSEVRFGIDGPDTWVLSDGVPITEPGQLAVTRFDLVSSLFWLSLPFVLAELPATITDLGQDDGEGGVRWHRLKAEFETPNAAVPGKWFVFYFNTETGLIDRVHARLTAPFLLHELWVGKWLKYRNCDGLILERQRQFFPANADGDVVGSLVAEQFVEHVRFNNGFGPEHFRKPAVAAGTRAVRWSPVGDGVRLAPVAEGS